LLTHDIENHSQNALESYEAKRVLAGAIEVDEVEAVLRLCVILDVRKELATVPAGDVALLDLEVGADSTERVLSVEEDTETVTSL
jgi:hypothetical protein